MGAQEKSLAELKITLKTPLQYLKGVGPERSKVLARLNLATVGDLLYFFPRRYEHRLPVKRISELHFENKECVQGVVASCGVMRLRTGQAILKVTVRDGKSVLYGMWFNQPYLQKVFLPKSKVVFYGKAEKSGSRVQMTHPEYEIFQDEVPAETVHTGRIVPIYPLTEDLGQKGLRQLVYRAIEVFSGLVRDPLEVSMRKRLDLPERAWAIRQIHFPSEEKNSNQAYRRLVFDEFFMMQAVLEMKKAEFQKESPLLAHKSERGEVERFLAALPFELTSGQEKAIWEIIEDMRSGRMMNRLVQGDVGSGKTVVGAAALVFTVVNGFQGALMAPTEVLAQQQYLTLSQLLEPLGISCGYLAQAMPAPEKEKVLAGIADGSIQVVIGTHALIQEAVKFKKLGLAVIDEQHKFGVFQRAALAKKSAQTPHLLFMTATPIPRTLSLTLYGDLDISVMDQLPSGRQPIRTLWVGEARRGEIYKFLDSLLEKGGQGYVLCPLVDAKASLDAKNIFKAYEDLSKILTRRKFGILHGKMKSAEKKKVMQEFKEKKIDVLISTVVIEVGIDVPNANIMMIENAERFGLAQLHQLRGRVGRGTEESFCVLFSEAQGEESIERLEAFTKIQSGFDIAEKDLSLRGGGDMIGEKQHGLPELRIGDVVKDIEILQLAKKEARAIVAADTKLILAQNRLIRRAIESRYGIKNNTLTVLA